MSEFGPSFYGEVLPTFSRAVDDEEDEDDANVEIFCSSVLRWSPEAQAQIDNDGHISCNVLIVAVEKVATAFIKTQFLHKEVEKIGVICSGLSNESVGSLKQDQFSDETCYLYRLKSEPSVIFCQCNTKVTSEQAYSWVSNLFSVIINPHTYVAVLTHRPVAEYKSEQPSSLLNAPFLRALKTTHYQGTPTCDYLEQPNIIDGLPAQVLTHCQVTNVPAVLYICYSENMYLDVNSVLEFTKLTSVTPFKDFYNVNSNAGGDLTKLIEQDNKMNTLYL